MELTSMSDYELAALYCDYSEWLQSPATGPTNTHTVKKYQKKMEHIMAELGRRHAPAVSSE